MFRTRKETRTPWKNDVSSLGELPTSSQIFFHISLKSPSESQRRLQQNRGIPPDNFSDNIGAKSFIRIYLISLCVLQRIAPICTLFESSRSTSTKCSSFALIYRVAIILLSRSWKKVISSWFFNLRHFGQLHFIVFLTMTIFRDYLLLKKSYKFRSWIALLMKICGNSDIF